MPQLRRCLMVAMVVAGAALCGTGAMAQDPVAALRIAGGLSAGSTSEVGFADMDGTDHAVTITDVLMLLGSPDILLADFEGPDYGGWVTTGTAFGIAPATGTLPGQQPVSGFLGHGLVNTFRNGDSTTGTLTSPEFRISRKHISFLLGGGAHPGHTAVNLLVNGQAVRTATGADSEALKWFSWDVGDLVGKTARIRIVDSHTGGWGHINVDHILMSDRLRVADEGLLAWWSFREGTGAMTLESVSGAKSPIADNAGRPEWVPGPVGTALRLDGYSTYVPKQVPPDRQPTSALTVQAWAAIEAYPVSNAPFINQYTFPGSGWFFGMEPWGAWYLAVSINGQWHTCWANGPFPKGAWVHIAGTFEKGQGMAIYLNGERVGTASTPYGDITPEPSAAMMIGRDAHTPVTDNVFATGVINGLIDEVKVHRRALRQPEVVSAYAAGTPVPLPDFSIPESRYAGDIHRPRYHPIPGANWTNEPHGLVYFNGAYHMFFQKNPNGPFWAQIHWGHLVSKDLARWDEWPIALAPERGYDEGGIWSGNAVVNNGVLTAIYTAKGAGGIALATSPNGGIGFQKFAGNPVLFTPPGYEPFRDPYVWRTGSYWYMVVGSALNGRGAAPLFRSADLVSWTYLRPMLQGDPATSGTFWEMPGFVPVGHKWMFYVSTLGNGPARELYWLGRWENEQFIPDPGYPKQMDVINHMLSPAITVGPDGRTILVGLNFDFRGGIDAWRMGYVHGFTLPRVMTLAPDGTLAQDVAPEVSKLRASVEHRENLPIVPNVMNLTGLSGDRVEIQAEIAPGTASQFGLRVRANAAGTEQALITYDALRKIIGVVDQSGPFTLAAGENLKLRVFIDGSSLEVFANGRSVAAWHWYAPADAKEIGLYASGGTANLVSMDVWQMKAMKDIPLL